jgi:hypothetical protein
MVYTEQESFRTDSRAFSKPVRAIQYIINGNGCHIVVSHKAHNGYARVRIANKLMFMHRYIWEKYNGVIPAGLVVCHSCDEPLCINVDHLFLGTPQDNIKDMNTKGRHFIWTPERRAKLGKKNKGHFARKGSDNPRSKLTEEIVRLLRTSERKVSIKKLCEKYAVSENTIYSIWRRRTWKDV